MRRGALHTFLIIAAPFFGLWLISRIFPEQKERGESFWNED
jgi:hypothetical protein